jgi:dTDP-4-dehydrorhamnose reductase
MGGGWLHRPRPDVRVAVTGAGGRLGSALVHSFQLPSTKAARTVVPWYRSGFDLDAPDDVADRLEQDRIGLVLHAAAWTDVDGCARDPELAYRRNRDATAALARACAERGIDLVFISTNEVFGGARTDGHGYRAVDPTEPANVYGASKLAGELACREAYDRESAGRGKFSIIRTAWLFGPGKPDFPTKILAAAERASARREALRVVGDEFGNPTYVADLADAIRALLVADRIGGIHHLVNGPAASRAEWARDILVRAGVEVPLEEIPGASWSRASVPPRWGVLESSSLPSGVGLRPWREAMAAYEPTLLHRTPLA